MDYIAHAKLDDSNEWASSHGLKYHLLETAKLARPSVWVYV